VGKTVNMLELITHRQQYSGLSVFAGRRAHREGNDFYHEMIESGVIDKTIWPTQVAMVTDR